MQDLFQSSCFLFHKYLLLFSFTHKIVFGCFSKPIAWFDRRVIDGTFNFMAWGTQEAGETIRPWQSGDVRSYAIWFLTGTVALTLCLLALL